MKRIVPIILFMMCLWSCEETVIDYTSHDQQTDDIQDSTNKVDIGFSLFIDNYATRAEYSPLGPNRYVTVYVNVTNGPYVTKVRYITTNTSTLSPINNVLTLAGGKAYNFYAVSASNLKYQIPNFINSIVTPIEYNIDYLQGNVLNVTPTHTDHNYDLYLSHLCTQVSFVLTTAQGVTLTDLSSIELTPSSTQGINWNIYSGMIGPSTSISPTYQPMDLTQTSDSTYVGVFIMPPLKLSTEGLMNVKLNTKININGVNYNRAYITKLPVPNNALQPNYSYRYNAILRKDSVVFTETKVDDWIPVVDGTPIVPDIY